MNTIDSCLQEGVGAHRRGDLAEAARLYRAALDIDADNASAHNNLGFVLGQQAQWPEALAHLRTAVRLSPRMSMAHSNLGQTLVATGETEVGLTHLEQAVAFDAGNPIAWDNLARIRILIGDFEGGEYAAMRALRISPQDARLCTRLGIALAAQRRFAEALQCYRQALQIEREHVEAWVQLGIVCFLRNDLGSALDALDTALVLTPRDANALRHRALVRASLGRVEEGIADFEQVLALQPDDAVSRIDVAVLHLSRREFATALAQLEQVQDGAARESEKYRFYVGVALVHCDRMDDGRALLTDVARGGGAYCDRAREIAGAMN